MKNENIQSFSWTDNVTDDFGCWIANDTFMYENPFTYDGDERGMIIDGGAVFRRKKTTTLGFICKSGIVWRIII